jgi:hypothetical protein
MTARTDHQGPRRRLDSRQDEIVVEIVVEIIVG